MKAAGTGTVPLEAWVAARMGIGGPAPTWEQIRRYQLEKLQESVAWAAAHSPFYRQRLRNFTGRDLAGLEDLRRLPFTTAEDLRQHGPLFLAVSQSDISRVVTLDSSGTTGQAKRLYFTPDDQEITVGFFRHGMAALTGAGDRVLILLPGERSGGVGDLLASALTRLGAAPIRHGPVGDISATLGILEREEVNCLVGTPSQVLALARWAETVVGQRFRLKGVLLSTDHVPETVVAELRRLWDCAVFQHYGMTEMGLGGGTECAVHTGYHLHEADFYYEIVDPLTGEALPEGAEGEVVVTTLTRRGMPLLRYRTGDLSRFLPERCGCGATLRRLAKITARVGGWVSAGAGRRFTIADLDEVLFAVGGVIDFTAKVDDLGQATKLAVSALTAGRPAQDVEAALRKALDMVPAIRERRLAGLLAVTVRAVGCDGTLAPALAKRTIIEWKETDGR